jgi:hypothetical protein
MPNIHPTRFADFNAENARLCKAAIAASQKGNKTALTKYETLLKKRVIAFQAETKKLKAAGLPH